MTVTGTQNNNNNGGFGGFIVPVYGNGVNSGNGSNSNPYNIDPVTVTGGGGSSSSGSGGGGGFYFPTYSYYSTGNNSSNTQTNTNSRELTEEEKKRLKTSLDSLMKRCGYKKLIEVMNSKITYNIDAKNNAGGGVYRADLKQIKISDGDLLDFQGLIIHEMFHGYQHQEVYGNAFGNYSQGKDGNINIEFEQIVFQDIVNHISRTRDGYDNQYLDDIGGRRFTERQKEGYGKAFEDYEEWINTLTNNGTTYPDLRSMSNFNAEFHFHLNNFSKYGTPGYTNSKILSDLNPEALKKNYSTIH